MKQFKIPAEKGGHWLAASALSLYIQFGLQLVLGVVLGLSYSATIGGAFASAANDGWLRSLHYWGSAILILHSVSHLLAMTWLGWFRPPHQIRYLVSLGMAAMALGFQISGNLLPFDRHGVQTTAIEASIAARIPVVGEAIRNAMVGGEDFGQNTLTRWFQAHVYLLPTVLIFTLLVGIVAHRRIADTKVSADSKLTVSHFTPFSTVSLSGRWIVLFPLLAVLGLTFGLGHPSSSAAQLADFDQFDALVSWYTWPGHGLLVAFDKVGPNLGWLGTAGVPSLFGAFFLSLPLLGNRWSLSVVRGVVLGLAVSMLAVSLMFGGKFAPLVGVREPGGVVPVVTPAPVEKPREPQDAKLAALGREIFADEGCKGCHGVDGLSGKSGPSLKNTYKIHSDLDYYIRYIKNPKSVKSGSTMPAYDELTNDQLKALAEFLRYPRK